MAKVKVTFENIAITNNGQPFGKGGLYWVFQVDGETVSERTVSNPLKVADGETVSISAQRQVTKDPGQNLTVYGAVSEKDDLSQDESATFSDSFKPSENWGAQGGTYKRRLVDRKLDVTVSYRIDLV
jgi:hypothetical protein